MKKCGFTFEGLGLVFMVLIAYLAPYLVGSNTEGIDANEKYKMKKKEYARPLEILSELEKQYSELNLSRLVADKVGEESEIDLPDGKLYVSKALSLKPPIFEFKDFLSSEECDRLIELAQENGLETSRTLGDDEESDIERFLDLQKFDKWDKDKNGSIEVSEVRWILEQIFDFDYGEPEVAALLHRMDMDQDNDGFVSKEEFSKVDFNNTAERFIKFINKIKEERPSTKGRFSEQTFLKNVVDPLLLKLRQRLSWITGLPLDLVENSEDLQVVKYVPGGHYNCHLDSEEIMRESKNCCHIPNGPDDDSEECQLCRYMTILYFLNDVQEGGETAFPLAGNKTFNLKLWNDDPDGMCNLARNCQKSKVVVKPEKGKAIVWYNHHVRKKSGWLGQVDFRSYHGGCNVLKGQKWIANNWINAAPFKTQDLRNWAWSKFKEETGYDDEGENIDDKGDEKEQPIEADKPAGGDIPEQNSPEQGGVSSEEKTEQNEKFADVEAREESSTERKVEHSEL
eukprot:Seg1891.3 transcript_id=Seg1891.3/GoldUCD/mRNA.D3Y31 product="Transmembrane prolyl 4-hydroxylase" protein_id=Seg1891.3/GoldUCD/D3Y31